MIDLLIKKIVEENNILEQDKKIAENNKFICEILNKILNKINISSSDTDKVLDLLKHDSLLTNLEKETLEFVFTILLPNNMKLEQAQKDILNKLLTKYSKIVSEEFNEKINRNNKLIAMLESEEIFLYFDDLNTLLKEYGIDIKDRLKIIKELIHKNYSAQLEHKVTDLSVASEAGTNIITDEISVYEKIDIENDDTIADNVSISEEMIIKSDTEQFKKIMSFFKENKLYYDKLDDTLKEKINTYGLNIEQATNIINVLKNIGINIRSYYSNNSEKFVNLILFSTIESMNEVVAILSKRNISLKKILNFDTRIFYSIESGGLLESFKDNITFLDSLDYDYNENTDLELYYTMSEDLKNVYYLYTKIYRFKLSYLENICLLKRKSLFPILDRLVEISNRSLNLVEKTDMRLFDIYNKEIFHGLKVLETMGSEGDLISKLSFLMQLKKKENDFKVDDPDDVLEHSELYNKLNSYFTSIEDEDNCVMYVIPQNVKVDETIFNNEYIDYLENNYKKDTLTYIVNRTRVSRIKVLRILSYLNSQGIDINQEVIQYALRFNYIYTENDLENIMNIFESKEKNRK